MRLFSTPRRAAITLAAIKAAIPPTASAGRVAGNAATSAPTASNGPAAGSPSPSSSIANAANRPQSRALDSVVVHGSTHRMAIGVIASVDSAKIAAASHGPIPNGRIARANPAAVSAKSTKSAIRNGVFGVIQANGSALSA